LKVQPPPRVSVSRSDPGRDGCGLLAASSWPTLPDAEAMRPRRPANRICCWENRMMTVLKVATCQFPVSADIEQNAGWITQQMHEAARHGARVAHFPEGALSGYAGTDFQTFTGYNWDTLPTACGNAQPSWVSGWSPGPRTGSAASARRTTACT